MKKFIYLFLALLFPTIIFIFLKYEGRNEFNIPVYYEKGVDEGQRCGYDYAVPYRIADSVLRSVEVQGHRAGVIIFHGKTEPVQRLLAELQAEFSTADLRVNDIRNSEPDSTMYNFLKFCVFLSGHSNEAVLVDHLGRIRGYYDPFTRKEMDRLRVELKILLQANHD